MLKIEHNITSLYQTPTELCGPTTLAMQLLFLNLEISAKEIVHNAQFFKSPADQGYSSQELAKYCLSLKYKIDFYSFDGRTMDFSWENLSQDELQGKLESLCEFLENESPINEVKLRYALSYLNLIKRGGRLFIKPFVTSNLIIDLLEKGPVAAGVAFCILASDGKRNFVTNEIDPFSGGFGTHSILIYGYDDVAGFMIADPAHGRGRIVVSPENLLAAITAAQVEDDNVLYQVLI